MTDKKIEILRVQLKTTYSGLLLNVIIPITVIIGIYILAGRGIVASGGFDFFGKLYLQIIFCLLLAASIGDFLAIYFIRKRQLENVSRGEGETIEESFKKAAMRLAQISYLLNMLPVGYGLAMLVLGAPFEASMLFVALTLVGYQLFRPRRKYLEKLYQRLEESGS